MKYGIDWIVKPPIDPLAKETGIGKFSIDSLEQLENEKLYKSKTNMFSLAFAIILIYDILGGLFIIKNWNPPEPALYEISAHNIKTKNYQDKRLIIFNKPRHTEAAIQKWAQKTLNDLYNFDFLNMNQNMERIKKYFTASGYEKFVEGMKAIDGEEKIVGGKMTINTIMFDKVIFPSTFGKTKVMEENDNVYYQLEVPVRMTAQKGDRVEEYDAKFNIMLVLLVDSNGKTGFFINEFNISELQKVI